MKAARRERIHPRTVKEAEYLRNKAIEKIDFEAAAEFQADPEDLTLLDREGALGEIATQYLSEKARLADSLDEDRIQYAQDDDKECDQAIQRYDNQFEDLQESQTQELESLFARWRGARQTVLNQSDHELQLRLNTAKELARQTKFREAMRARDSAFHQKTVQLAQANGEVDAHYDALVRGMLDRHQTALNTFVRRRKCETGTHKMLQDGAAATARRAFAVDNAANIFEITSLTTRPEFTLPLALAHQTVHATPEQKAPPPEFESEFPLRGKTERFREALESLEQNVLTACPLEQSSSPIKKRFESERRKTGADRRAPVVTPRSKFVPTGNIFLQILSGKTLDRTTDRFLQTPVDARARDSDVLESPRGTA
jgi:hypothetical protein